MGTPRSGAATLKRLSKLKDSYGPGAARAKVDLLAALDGTVLGSARELLELHEILCFLRAWPDDGGLLSLVVEMLRRFGERRDLRRFRRGLADSGVAGTALTYSFYWPTAKWLVRRWPGRLSIVWRDFEKKDRLEKILHLLATYSETPGLDEFALSPREWIERLKGPDETDAAFLIRRFEALPGNSFTREASFEALDVPIRIAPGPDGPDRTRAFHETGSAVFQAGPLDRKRPSLRRAVLRPPLSVRPLSGKESERLIDLAREAMVTRSRDLDVFAYADARDVRMVDCGGGLSFACFGALPERRLMFEAVYGFLTFKNGVPIGYVLTSALFGSVQVAYNVFETFRGAESAFIYGRVLAMARALFGADSFMVDPYQLGHDNDEGLRSGAWWFYYKLGFRPHDPGVRRLVAAERERMGKKPGHRSSRATLQSLTAEPMFLYLGRPRKDVLGRIGLGNLGMAVTRYLAGRFGSEREKGIRTCSREAARLLGEDHPGGFSAGEKLAWERWSPLVLTLPGVDRWSRGNRRALARIVRAKGGRRESDFVALFDGHRLLRRSLLRLAETGGAG